MSADDYSSYAEVQALLGDEWGPTNTGIAAILERSRTDDIRAQIVSPAINRDGLYGEAVWTIALHDGYRGEYTEILLPAGTSAETVAAVARLVHSYAVFEE